MKEAEQKLAERGRAAAVPEGGSHRRGHRRGRRAVDRHSRHAHARGRARAAHAARPGAGAARRRAGRGGAARWPTPCAARAPGCRIPNRPDRLVHLPRPHRRRQDGDGARARRVPVRRRARDGAHRHVGVHGEARRRAADRRAAGLRRLRGGRPAHRGRAPPSVLGHPVRRDREGAPGRVQHPAADPRRRPAHRLAGAHGGLPEHRHHHDVEHRQPRASSSTRASDWALVETQVTQRAAAALQARVPQPRRRHHHLPAARRRSRSSTSSTCSSQRLDEAARRAQDHARGDAGGEAAARARRATIRRSARGRSSARSSG